MIAGDLLVVGCALTAAALVILGLRSRLDSTFLLVCLAAVAAFIAAVSSFVIGFTIAWTYQSADLWVILASAACAIIAAAVIVGPIRLVSAK